MSNYAATGNILAGIPDAIGEELENILLEQGPVTVKRIISRGQSSPAEGWYDQADHEWVLVLAGEGLLAFDNGEECAMGKGDYCFIPAHRKHRVKWTASDSNTIWLAIHVPAQTQERGLT